MRARGTQVRPMRAQRRALPECQEGLRFEGVEQQEAEEAAGGSFRLRSGRWPEDRGQARRRGRGRGAQGRRWDSRRGTGAHLASTGRPCEDRGYLVGSVLLEIEVRAHVEQDLYRVS